MLNVAVIGATGAVGREMLLELEHYDVQCSVGLFASQRSAGSTLLFRGEEVVVQEFALEHLKGFDYVLMSAGGGFSNDNTRAIAAEGCTVIDNSSAWRMAEDVALVVPEVNPGALRTNHSRIIANPNCSTIQLVLSLKPLADQFGLAAVNVSTYQSVSGSGQFGIDELARQSTEWVAGSDLTCQKYHRPIFDNLIPAIDVMREGGHCFEEEKMIEETRKILNMPELPVLATTVRVPVFKCHSESVTVVLDKRVRRQDVYEAFADRPGIELRCEDSYDHFAYPKDIADRREVVICRLRLPFGHDASHTVQYWNVADNLKKGAATNAVQILTRLLNG